MSLLNELNQALENVNEVTYRTRLSICKGSNTGVPCQNYIVLTQMCKGCGCFLPVKAKLKSQSCPLNKWR